METASWSSTKKMIVSKYQRRWGGPPFGMWGPWREERHCYYVWNSVAGRTERYLVDLFRGVVTCEVIPGESGAESHPKLPSARGTTAQMTHTVTNCKWKVEITNRKNSKGNPLPDVTWAFTRRS